MYPATDNVTHSVTPFDLLLDYERQAQAHVAGAAEQVEAPGLWRGIAFRVGTHHLGSGIAEVSEILTLPPMTTIPGTKPWLLGVANIRRAYGNWKKKRAERLGGGAARIRHPTHPAV